MKKIICVVLSWMCSLAAVELPFEEKLTISLLDNGVDIWLKQHASPKEWVSFRVVAKNPLQEIPQIISLDCPSADMEEELACFIDDCRQSIQNADQCKISVVAVGDFEKDPLEKYLRNVCEIFTPRSPSSTRKIVIHPSPQPDTIYLTLSYPTSFQELRTDQDLKKLWILYLLQSIAEERFRHMAKDINGQWVQPAESKYLLPYTQCIARGKHGTGQEPTSMLMAFLIAMQELKSNGFSEQELIDAKGKLQKNIMSFFQQTPTNSILAEYIASNAAFGAGCPDYTLFMRLSFSLIGEISRKDIGDLMGSYFKDDTRYVEIKAPPQVDITEAKIEQTLNEVKTDDIVLDLSKNDSDREGQTSFDKLPMTEEEAQTIHYIIDTLGTTNVLFLAPKYFELRELGNQVQHVHPLKFLGTVFTNPHLKQCMVNIEDSSVKWNGFLDGSGKTPGFLAKCEREYARNNFTPHILGFCQTVKAHPDQVRTLIEQKEWEKLVRMLIHLDN